MTPFRYRAARADGGIVEGLVDAGSAAQASATVTDRGLFPLTVTPAEPVATAEVHENSADSGKIVSDAPGVDTSWRSSYDKSVNALANFANGGSATASGRLKASVAVSEDHLQYKSSINAGEMVTYNGCADCIGTGTFTSTSIIQFSVTKRLQFSFSASLSAAGGFARVAFTGNGVDEGHINIPQPKARNQRRLRHLHPPSSRRWLARSMRSISN